MSSSPRKALAADPRTRLLRFLALSFALLAALTASTLLADAAI